jgi:PucR C-terminal helix-turn-helix domain/GGDEF-like domain
VAGKQRQRLTPVRPVAALAERLAARRPEIEEAILARAYSVSDPTEIVDPSYIEGLRDAVSAAVAYGLAGIEGRGADTAAVPGELLAQARQAAQNGVSLDTVLRRYFAGYSVLGDFLGEEARTGGLLQADEFQHLLRIQAELFDRLITVVTEEHTRQANSRVLSQEQRRAECVKKLLAGELADTAELAYDLDGWHLGAVAVGPEAERAICALAAARDWRLLRVRFGQAIWAWLGAWRKMTREDLEHLAATSLPGQISMTLGEPGEELAGWRLTHRQAIAALPVALRGPRAVTRYAEVTLLASILQDEVLTASLREMYLSPLAGEHDDGETLRETLRAYFAAERNVTSSAAALGVSRPTVANRLRAVEKRIGRQLNGCATEMEAALQLDALGAVPRVLPRGR